MRIGHLEVRTIRAGTVALDGGAMFGVVPRALWARHIPPDDRNRIHLAMRVLIVRAEDRTIVVDMGIGTGWSDKERDRLGVVEPRALRDALHDAGVDPDAVTDVVLTHLHFDHAGGIVEREGPRATLALPEAVHHVQARNLAWARRPTPRDRASYSPWIVEALDELARHGKLRLVEGDTTLWPDVAVRVSDGHTTGMQMVVVRGPTGGLVYPADLVPTRAHLPLAWNMGFDLRPLVVMEEKERLLDEAVERDWIVVFEHDPEVAAARVQRDGRGRFGVREVVARGELT